jgi:hypothetical protein
LQPWQLIIVQHVSQRYSRVAELLCAAFERVLPQLIQILKTSSKLETLRYVANAISSLCYDSSKGVTSRSS